MGGATVAGPRATRGPKRKLRVLTGAGDDNRLEKLSDSEKKAVDVLRDLLPSVPTPKHRRKAAPETQDQEEAQQPAHQVPSPSAVPTPTQARRGAHGRALGAHLDDDSALAHGAAAPPAKPEPADDDAAAASVGSPASASGATASPTPASAGAVSSPDPTAVAPAPKPGSTARRRKSRCPYCKPLLKNCGLVAGKCPNRPCNTCGGRHRLGRCRKRDQPVPATPAAVASPAQASQTPPQPSPQALPSPSLNHPASPVLPQHMQHLQHPAAPHDLAHTPSGLSLSPVHQSHHHQHSPQHQHFNGAAQHFFPYRFNGALELSPGDSPANGISLDSSKPSPINGGSSEGATPLGPPSAPRPPSSKRPNLHLDTNAEPTASYVDPLQSPTMALITPRSNLGGACNLGLITSSISPLPSPASEEFLNVFAAQSPTNRQTQQAGQQQQTPYGASHSLFTMFPMSQSSFFSGYPQTPLSVSTCNTPLSKNSGGLHGSTPSQSGHNSGISSANTSPTSTVANTSQSFGQDLLALALAGSNSNSSNSGATNGNNSSSGLGIMSPAGANNQNSPNNSEAFPVPGPTTSSLRKRKQLSINTDEASLAPRQLMAPPEPVQQMPPAAPAIDKPSSSTSKNTNRQYTMHRKRSSCPYCEDVGSNCGLVAGKCPNRPCKTCNGRHRHGRCRLKRTPVATDK